MKLENSPTLDMTGGVSPEPQKDENSSRKRSWVLIAIIAVFVVFLGAANLVKGGAVTGMFQTGSVQGKAFDKGGHPLTGNIYVVGTKLAAKINPDGSFLIENVPVGQRVVVIADLASGIERPVTVLAGQTVDLGVVQLVTTAVP